MYHRAPLLIRMAAVLLGLISTSPVAPASPPSDSTIPPFFEVQQAVVQYFKEKQDFKPGDLITRDTVARLLARLQKTWLPPVDAKKILERVPDEDDFLVKQLSTPDGRQFMRRIANYPDAYDRLDRLSRMPYGRQTVAALVRGPGGEKMIEYMTKTPGGRELGKQLSNSPDGKDFNEPTGRIYTMAMLLTQLQQTHAAVVKAAGRTVTN